MPLPILIFLICFFKMTLVSTPNYVDYFIVRNVGQGLWTTRVQNATCEHYDFGGEIFHGKKLKKQFIAQCFNKLNILNLSHTHEDHHAFLGLIVNNSRSVCWSTRPPEPLKHEPLGIPYCRYSSTNQILFYDNDKTNKNDRSIVQIVHQFLIPGDSSIKMEKVWSEKLRHLNRPIKYLLLGHHGSRTATGDHLLTKLPALKQALVSARFQRYRHPHIQTTKKLREHKVPLIKTEDWGDIRINY
jgi:competence protein ComEC